MIEAAICPDGALADEFLRALEQSRKEKDMELLATILQVFEDFAHRDSLHFPREINDLGDGIREIKPDKSRFPFFAVPGTSNGAVRLTHGFYKKQRFTERYNINKAKWVRKEDLKP